MIRVSFSERDGALCGFTMKGHAGAADCGHDIVCAAVSSAAYMAANTLTEICRCGAVAEAEEGYMRVTVEDTASAADILNGLRLHLDGLREQYPDCIKITTDLLEV